MKSVLKQFALACLLASGAGAHAQAPAGYPGDYDKTIAAARAEGKVVVYSVLSNKAAAALVQGFKTRYPGIAVEYDGESGSNEVADRFTAELHAGKPSADVMWSSAMDLQMKLVGDGHAAGYVSPEAARLPAWAVYRDQAWGTTYEPVVFVYNKRLVAESEAPQDRAALAKLLRDQPEKYRGKVTTFDVEKSGAGYMFAAQDLRATDSQRGKLDELLQAMGSVGLRQSAGTGEMLTKVNSGEYLIGYNIMGAYAMSRSTKDLPALGVVLPRDGTQVLTRVMFINRQAAHPNAARLWVDYVLSKSGQKIIADALELYTVRDDVDAERTASKLAQRIGGSARPIPLSLDTAEPLDPVRQRQAIGHWKAQISAGAR